MTWEMAAGSEKQNTSHREERVRWRRGGSGEGVTHREAGRGEESDTGRVAR